MDEMSSREESDDAYGKYGWIRSEAASLFANLISMLGVYLI